MNFKYDIAVSSASKSADKTAILANQIFSSFAFALYINDFSLFYFDHSFANAVKPRSRSVQIELKQTFYTPLSSFFMQKHRKILVFFGHPHLNSSPIV